MDTGNDKAQADSQSLNTNIPFYQEEQKKIGEIKFRCFDKRFRKAGFVSEMISKENFEEWGYEKPIFISAQTGSGKNRFIEDSLIPHIERTYVNNSGLPLKLLILSNRLALNFQAKKRFIKNLKLSDSIDERNNEDIKNETDFGIITLISYQSLLSEIYNLEGRYTHIICDECHFFTTDALFNPYTGKILEKIVNEFSRLVRIYMSATMEDCMEFIVDYEINASKNRKEYIPGFIGLDNHFVIYELEKDYSYLNIQYFSDESELVDKIKESKDKWLIFIDSKKRGKAFKETLENTEACSKEKNTYNKAMCIDANKKSNKGYLKMLENEMLPEDVKVLIATSVIDNGVNFRGKNLKNIVIEEIDKVKFLQLLGRKRVEKNEKVNLYIKIVNDSDVKKRINSLKSLMRAFSAHEDVGYEDFHSYVKLDTNKVNQRNYFNHFYYNGLPQNFLDAKHLFYRDYYVSEVVHPNKIASDFIKTLYNRYNSILREIQEIGTGTKYLKFQLSWFEMSHDCIYDEANDISLQRFFEAIMLLDKVGIIPKTEQLKFSKEFAKRYTLAYGKRKSDTNSRILNNGYGKNIINKVLNELNVGLQIATARNGDWIIKGEINMKYTTIANL